MAVDTLGSTICHETYQRILFSSIFDSLTAKTGQIFVRIRAKTGQTFDSSEQKQSKFLGLIVSDIGANQICLGSGQKFALFWL